MFGRTTYEEPAAHWTGDLGDGFDPRIADSMNRLAMLVVSDSLESVSWLDSPIGPDVRRGTGRLQAHTGEGRRDPGQLDPRRITAVGRAR